MSDDDISTLDAEQLLAEKIRLQQQIAELNGVPERKAERLALLQRRSLVAHRLDQLAEL